LLWWEIARLTPNARRRDLKAVGQLIWKCASVEVVEGDALCRLQMPGFWLVRACMKNGETKTRLSH
jgi:hypothetical protein